MPRPKDIQPLHIGHTSMKGKSRVCRPLHRTGDGKGEVGRIVRGEEEHAATVLCRCVPNGWCGGDCIWRLRPSSHTQTSWISLSMLAIRNPQLALDGWASKKLTRQSIATAPIPERSNLPRLPPTRNFCRAPASMPERNGDHAHPKVYISYSMVSRCGT